MATRGGDLAQRRAALRVSFATAERKERTCHLRLLKSRTAGQDLAWHVDEARAAATTTTALALEATAETCAPRVSRWDGSVSFAALPARRNTELLVQLQSPALSYVEASATYGDVAGVALPNRRTPSTDRS